MKNEVFEYDMKTVYVYDVLFVLEICILIHFAWSRKVFCI